MRAWLIAGTVPDDDFPLYFSADDNNVRLKSNSLALKGDRDLPVGRGTTALVAAALAACSALGAHPPRILLVGDCGSGKGSRDAYQWLAANIADQADKAHLKGITFHYFYPDLDGHNKFYAAVEGLAAKPLLVADAGFMYAAKMSGYAAGYDLFTPDIGELAFLADEKAPHPFYTRGFLSAQTEDVPRLLTRSGKYDNRPANMIVKGKNDFIMVDNRLLAKIAEPSVAAMECIGGTGDIVTGFATAFLAAGFSVGKSAVLAALAARELAAFCNPDPSWQAAALIEKIEPMLIERRNDMEKWADSILANGAA